MKKDKLEPETKPHNQTENKNILFQTLERIKENEELKDGIIASCGEWMDEKFREYNGQQKERFKKSVAEIKRTLVEIQKNQRKYSNEPEEQLNGPEGLMEYLGIAIAHIKFEWDIRNMQLVTNAKPIQPSVRFSKITDQNIQKEHYNRFREELFSALGGLPYPENILTIEDRLGYLEHELLSIHKNFYNRLILNISEKIKTVGNRQAILRVETNSPQLNIGLDKWKRLKQIVELRQLKLINKQGPETQQPKKKQSNNNSTSKKAVTLLQLFRNQSNNLDKFLNKLISIDAIDSGNNWKYSTTSGDVAYCFKALMDTEDNSGIAVVKQISGVKLSSLIKSEFNYEISRSMVNYAIGSNFKSDNKTYQYFFAEFKNLF